MTASLPSFFALQFFDDAGNPVAGGSLYTYANGTTTPQTTWSDEAGTVPNANPIILDAAGRCKAFLSTSDYTFTLKTSGGALVKTWDNVAGVANASAIAGKLDSSTAASTYALKNNTVLTGTLSVAGAATFSSTISTSSDAASANDVPRFSQVSNLTLPKFSNLSITASGTSSNVSVTADQVITQGTGVAYKASAVSLTINSAASGANGLDVGSIAANTWYSVWVIYNPNTSTVAGLTSLSATSPTMPSGYTAKCRVGWFITDSTANKYPLSYEQFNSMAHYKIGAGNVTAAPSVINGNQGVATQPPTWVAASLTGVIPVTAKSYKVMLVGSSGSGFAVIAAPNNSYQSYAQVGAPPLAIVSGNPGTYNTVAMFPRESDNVYYASTSGTSICGVSILGWEDNL